MAALLALPASMPLCAFSQPLGQVISAGAPVVLSTSSGLRLAPQLEEHPLRAGHGAAKFVLGDQIEAQGEQQVTVSGAAEVRTPTLVIKGDRLHYDAATDQADAYGNVRIINKGNTFSGPEAHLKVKANEGYMLSPHYHFNAGGSGSAQRIDVLDPERTVVTHGTYTGCPCPQPAWNIKASRVEFDKANNSGVARNGVLFFQQVPLFASPYLSFPLSTERVSGLLPPVVALGSTAGADVTLPYYFNLAPNRDLTLYPRYMSHRGTQLGADYRYLSPTYAGSINVEYLPHDEVMQSRRYAVYAQHRHQLKNGLGAYFNYNRVSDNTYPEDLTAGNIFMHGTQLLYQQEAGLTYNQGPWSALARVQRWQTLPPSAAPYGREPELNVKYERYDEYGFDFGAQANYSRFRIATADLTEGERIYLKPYLSYPLMTPAYFIVPKLQYHLASYHLSTLASTASPRQPRYFGTAIPTLSLDSGLVFERAVRFFGTEYIQTLEPRLYYVYTPYREQNFMPLFDTAEADFGLAEIYTENTFVGNDRVADASRLTAGITTRFTDPVTGDERGRIVAAQQYYFQQQRVTLLPNESHLRANHSDLLLGAALKLRAGFHSETVVQFNADNNQLIRSNIGFGWSPAERRVLNLAYRYTRANPTLNYRPIKQAVISAQWPLSRRLYGIGRLNYGLDSGRLVDSLLGFQYDADCWAFGLAIQRFANGIDLSGANATGTRVLAQLEFKGLSRIDNGLIKQLRASVPGYVELPPPPPPPSRFSNYE